MEKILEIKEVFDVQLPGKESSSWSNYDGFQVLTDKQTIHFLISNGQSCCESWGTLLTNDNIEEFIGAELKEITQTDTALQTTNYKNHHREYGYDEGDIMFLNLETDKGTLQFAVYNSHNGYYGHSVYIISEQLKVETGV